MASLGSLQIGNIQYVTKTELAKEDDSNSTEQLELTDDEYNVNVAYANGAHTVFVQQGQYVIPVDGHTVVLQDGQGDFEYIINNIDEFSNADESGQTITQPIIYYANEFVGHTFDDTDDTTETTEDGASFVTDEDSIIVPSPKRIKLETNFINAYRKNQEDCNVENDFVQVREEAGSDQIVIADVSEQAQLQQSQYQYAILKNGKLHLQTLDFADDTSQFNPIVNDGQQQLQEQLAAFQQSINMDDVSINTPTIDLEKITGRNLITGQTVTLDSYFDKLQRRLSTVEGAEQRVIYAGKQKQKSLVEQVDNRRSDTTENNFINRKFVIGTTSNGKKIVGKILRIHMTGDCKDSPPNDKQVNISSLDQDKKKKNFSSPLAVRNEEVVVLSPSSLGESKNAESPTDVLEINQDDSSQWNEDQPAEMQQAILQPHIIIKKHMVTRENFDYSIGKTLVGLMGLETVQRRLQNRNLVVKLVEKTYDHSSDAFNRTVSYVYGHMQLIPLEAESSENQKWAFVLHGENSNSTNADDENEGLKNDNRPVEGDEVGREHPTESCISKSNSKQIAHNDSDEDEEEKIKDISLEVDDHWMRYNETTSLTIIITVDKSGKKSTRVNLSPPHQDSRCHVCAKEFKSSLHMRKHLNNVHLCEKSARCESCGKNFANQTILQRHQKIHSGERWYQCPKCSKSFNTAGSLKRHLTVHDPSLRPLQCTVCSQRFTDESSLRKHLLIHTGIRAYVCEVCNRAFVNQGDLNFHRRIHDPVKQFSCEVCGREFSRHSNLMRHAEIHRGAGALHRCDVCGCSYSFISSLTRHIVQKHISQQ